MHTDGVKLVMGKIAGALVTPNWTSSRSTLHSHTVTVEIIK